VTEPVSARWARWRTALTMLTLTLVGLVGIGTSFVVADSGADSTASSADSPLPSPTEEPVASPEASPTVKKAKPRRLPTKAKQEKQQEKQLSLVDEVQDLLSAAPIAPTTTFRIASFNVLGSSHTARGGNKPGYASGPARMVGAVGMLRAHNVDVVGLQEYEPSQHVAFQRIAGDGYAVYPGLQIGTKGVRNSIAWRTDTWKLVTARTILIPYFRGNRVPMPYVLLEHSETGSQVWFINVHNPASSAKRGNNERWRDVGTALQIGLINRLRSATQRPVILTGDFNERAEAFCKVTSGAPVRAANGGTTGGRCVTPPDLRIDWIFGTEDITFSDYASRRSRFSDHPIVVSTATVGG